MIATFVACLFASSCGGSESKAERLYDKARKHVEAGELEEAIALYEQIGDDHPGSPAAQRARDEITLYRGLSSAVRNYEARAARDLMVQTARAIERYRSRHRRWPDALDRLHPEMMPEAPIDPWGRPLLYEKMRRGYRLACMGSDGKPGGEGDAADWFVENGRFVLEVRDPA